MCICRLVLVEFNCHKNTPLEASSGMVLACPSHFASFQKLSGSTVWEVLLG